MLKSSHSECADASAGVLEVRMYRVARGDRMLVRRRGRAQLALRPLLGKVNCSGRCVRFIFFRGQPPQMRASGLVLETARDLYILWNVVSYPPGPHRRCARLEHGGATTLTPRTERTALGMTRVRRTVSGILVSDMDVADRNVSFVAACLRSSDSSIVARRYYM